MGRVTGSPEMKALLTSLWCAISNLWAFRRSLLKLQLTLHVFKVFQKSFPFFWSQRQVWHKYFTSLVSDNFTSNGYSLLKFIPSKLLFVLACNMYLDEVSSIVLMHNTQLSAAILFWTNGTQLSQAFAQSAQASREICFNQSETLPRSG